MTFVIICLDGFKKDYIKDTEFLKGLEKSSLFGEVNHGFGFVSELIAITGKTNEELGLIANNFVYSSNKNFYYKMRFIDSLPLKNKFRRALDIGYTLKEFIVGNRQPKTIFNIPLKYMQYFDFLNKKNFFEKNSSPSKTIFEILENRKLSAYMWPFVYENKKTRLDILNLAFSSANTDKRAFEKSIKLLKKNPDICYIHFFSTDNLVHRLGTVSPRTRELIKILDDYVKEIANYADKLLIFSDHGMTDIKETIDIWNLINKESLEFGKDYLMFLDSTLARFWTFNKNAEKKIKLLLEKTKKGKLYTFKNKTIHKRFGNLIFQLNPGITINPNFYQDVPDKATHGYNE
ncbi:MAG: alkaline phosphatase family protein, partial [Candidatus Nanoarchaeia archaeon]